jgi:bifunctional DNA-binding transcriptional regulator/antitoxin component of YhaV-PrlF toxin-antitoxin module
MTVIVPDKTELTVPRSVWRKAGIKPGDQVDFSVSGRVINIIPKLSPDELQDEREIHDPKVRATIRKGFQEFSAGKSRPMEEFLAERASRAKKRGVRHPAT